MHYPTSPEQREVEYDATDLVEKERIDYQSIALAELSTVIVRGIFQNDLTEPEISCLVDDIVWFITNKLDDSFHPDTQAVVAGMQRSVVRQNHSTINSVDRTGRDTSTLQEVSWLTINRIFDKRLGVDDAGIMVDDLYEFIHDNLDESFQPDVEAVQRDTTIFTAKRNSNRATGIFTLNTLSAQQATKDDDRAVSLPQIGGRTVGEYLGFPN